MMEQVARALLGQPNKHQSSKTELRFGSHGSLSVDLQKGTFYNHEEAKGGGVVELIERETGRKGSEAIQWLRDNGFDVPENDFRPSAPRNGAQRQSAPPPAQRPAQREEERAPREVPDNGLPPGVPHHARRAAVYDYATPAGKLIFQVCRFEWMTDEGVREKTFRQRRPGTREGFWIWSVKGVEQVPYRVGDLMEAATRGSLIFIVEGEKDADNLYNLGVPVTCNAMGAGKWPEVLTPYFRDADVVILPDNDGPGRNHRDIVGKALHGVAKQVRVLDLPGLPEKGDVTDWLDAGGTIEQLYDLVESKAVRWSPPIDWTSKFNAVRWSDLDRPGEEHEWLIKGLLTRGERSMVAGPSQSGKSFAVLDMALSVARGVDYEAYAKLGGQRGWENRKFRTMRGGVIYQAGEGGRGIKKRLRAYREHHGIPVNADLPFVLLPSAVDLHGSDEDTNRLIEEIKHWSATFTVPLELIVIDTLSAATPGANENASDDMSRVLARCEKIAQASKAHVMIVHHMNAAGEKPRGHTSIFANLDNAMVVRKAEGLREPERIEYGPDGYTQMVPGREVREIILTKQKDGEDGTQIRFVLKSVTLGVDADGDRVSSCVVVAPQLSPEQEAEGPGKPVLLSDQAGVFYAAVRRAINEHGEAPPPSIGLPRRVRVVRWSHVVAKFRDMTFEAAGETDPKKQEDAIRKALSRHGEKLTARGVIARHTPFIWLTDKPVRGFRPHEHADSAERVAKSEDQNSPPPPHDDEPVGQGWGDGQ